MLGWWRSSLSGFRNISEPRFNPPSPSQGFALVEQGRSAKNMDRNGKARERRRDLSESNQPRSTRGSSPVLGLPNPQSMDYTGVRAGHEHGHGHGRCSCGTVPYSTLAQRLRSRMDHNRAAVQSMSECAAHTKSVPVPNPLPSALCSPILSSLSSHSLPPYHVASRRSQFQSPFVQHCSGNPTSSASSQHHIDNDAHSTPSYVDNSKSSDLFQQTVTTYTGNTRTST